MNFEPAKPWQMLSKAVAAVMDAAYKAHKDAEPTRKYLGGSMIGRDCEREIAYQYHQAPKEEVTSTDGTKCTGFSGQLYRIFDRGHKGEDRVAEYLRIAGFTLITHKQDGGQFGWKAMGGLMRGHIDGAITAGPEIPGICYDTPGLWENKILNSKTFAKLWNNGLKKTKPVYYAQVQLYMAYMELTWCLFTAENADNCEIYTEVVHFDAAYAQEMSDRGVRIIQSNAPEELPRVAGSADDYRCAFCDFKNRCWSRPAVLAEPIASPSWLAKPTDN